MSVHSYDPKCWNLAKAFLADRPELNNDVNAHNLALEIQQTIEDEIDYMIRLRDETGKDAPKR